MYKISPDNIARIKEMVTAGMSDRTIAATIPCAKRTVTNYRAQMSGALCACGRPLSHAGFCRHRYAVTVDVDGPRCPCGRVIGHRGWCNHRYGNSTARQKVIMRMHIRRLITKYGVDEVKLVIKQIETEPAKEPTPRKIETPKAEPTTRKPFSMFDGIPMIQPRQNTSWRRMDNG